MPTRYLALIAACAGIFVFNAEARPVTTDECLARGLCAYVSPKGRVTCGKCPGQARAVKVLSNTTAVCKDKTLETRKARSGACKGHGGVSVFLKPDAESAVGAAREKP